MFLFLKVDVMWLVLANKVHHFQGETVKRIFLCHHTTSLVIVKGLSCLDDQEGWVMESSHWELCKPGKKLTSLQVVEETYGYLRKKYSLSHCD